MKELIKEKWEEILEYLKIEHGISDVSFKTWIQPLKIYSVIGNIITIAIDDGKLGNSKKFIVNKFSLPLKVSIEEITGEEYELEFQLSSELKELPKESITPSAHRNKEEVKKETNQYPFLNPRYTFNTFVVGNNNTFAHAASLAVAESPGEIYNPLFIYGGVGLGKTHLMHSIAHYILEQNPTAKVLYVTSEKFTNELIEAIRNKADTNSIAEFRKKYRNIDVLLIDDIQFIIGKESTQEEFFHTFNTLHESKKQIIISSDKPPKDMAILEERLRSRFEWGLNVDIKSPDYETRMAILKKKEELDGLSIDNEVMKYIATNIKSNIRELEGALTQIVARSRLINKEVDVALAEEALIDLISPNNKRDITIELISGIVAEHYNINVTDLVSAKKSRNIAYPRQICMYLSRSLTDTSFQDIGRYFGNRDHTTIIHGCDKIVKDLEMDSNLKNTIDVLKKKINPQ
ncbi:MAG: chromosomal replication initiator protein DnaA [Velocimicrobium sp.]